MLIAYSRVSTQEQNEGLQIDALRAAGCERFFNEKASGGDRSRPELAKLLAFAQKGDVIVVWRLDRLARSVQHLCNIIEDLERREIGLRSLTEEINTKSPSGKLIFHIFAALAEFERSLIRERVNAGIAAAKARGVKFGRPSVISMEILDTARIRIANDESVRDIATDLGVSKTALYEALA